MKELMSILRNDKKNVEEFIENQIEVIIGCTNHRKNDSLKVTDDEIYVFVKMVLKDLEK